MEAMNIALWVERFAFCLLLFSTKFGSYGLLLLVLSNFLYYKSAMVGKAKTAKLKRDRSLRNSDSRTDIEEDDHVKSSSPNEGENAADEDQGNNKATSREEGEDSIMKSTLLEILKKATNACNAENISYWHEILVKKMEDELKEYRAVRDEELRKAKETCEEEFKNKLKIMEEKLEAKFDEDRRNWEKERRILKEKYEMMRWT